MSLSWQIGTFVKTGFTLGDCLAESRVALERENVAVEFASESEVVGRDFTQELAVAITCRAIGDLANHSTFISVFVVSPDGNKAEQVRNTVRAAIVNARNL
jgi:hypothetical protein